MFFFVDAFSYSTSFHHPPKADMCQMLELFCRNVVEMSKSFSRSISVLVSLFITLSVELNDIGSQHLFNEQCETYGPSSISVIISIWDLFKQRTQIHLTSFKNICFVFYSIITPSFQTLARECG